MTEQVKPDPDRERIDSTLTTSPAAVGVESAPAADTASTDPVVSVNVCNPLSQPYRTGSYLIYDFKQGDRDHFRSGSELSPNPYRASGSHQLDDSVFGRFFASIPQPAEPANLYLVDLREETHGFFGDRAVSWYADNDFSNVGYPWGWIQEEEAYRLAWMKKLGTARVFDVERDPSDNRAQERMRPTGYRVATVETARTEEQAFDNRAIGKFRVRYVRIPATDHCAPSDDALGKLRTLANEVTAHDWVHFHCHGGDGRTTTFLALYDMWRWKKANHPDYLSLEGFACRQYKLAPNYCLNPDGCDCAPPPPLVSRPTAGWKRPLELERWNVLERFHADPLGRGL
jgi:hypothetical protein